jgi:hypothetical protein
MTIGAEIPPAHPAPRGTVWVRAELVPGVHLALAARGGGDPWRWRSRGSDRGAGGAGSHATQWGLWVSPANDCGSLERGRRGTMGSAGLCGVAGHGLGQARGNMQNIQRSPQTTIREKNGCGIMAYPLHMA